MQRIAIVRQPAFALMLFGFLVIGFAFAEPKFATAAGLIGGSETGSKPPISGSGLGGRGNSIPGKQAGAGGSGSGVPSRKERRFMPKEIILGFRPSTTEGSIDQLASRYKVTRLGSQDFPLIGIKLYRWRVNGNRSVAATVRAIERESLVATAQPNYVFTLQEDQPHYSSGALGAAAQYVLAKLQIEQAHQIATGKEVAIAIIDSKVDETHPDLNGTVAERFDPAGGEDKPHEHGTAIAGAIAARGELQGIAIGPRLLVARAFDSTAGEAKGTSFAIYKSLQWAADNGARIVNMSFAGPPDPLLHRLLAAAYQKGMVLVAAAGNAGPKSAPLYPAADPNVIAVTATDNNDGLFRMANRGRYITVAAPGVDIIALAPGGSYQITSGTSIAAAHVTGIAALLLQEEPSLKPTDVRAIIMTTAKPSGRQTDFGAGLANAYRAAVLLRNSQPAGEADSQKTKP
jgi:subtilisin family serine protease